MITLVENAREKCKVKLKTLVSFKLKFEYILFYGLLAIIFHFYKKLQHKYKYNADWSRRRDTTDVIFRILFSISLAKLLF